ncbi:MAG: Crp/Fnr family transcriptional regulator [Actinobacteria bacterium]|nr:Crp/Fnr family transcriptional regulator [Actinomycetota bacterium]
MRMPQLQLREWIACCLGRGRLAPLGTDEIDRLAEEIGERRYAGGTTIFRRGERPAQIHIVREGSVELTTVLHGRRVSLEVLRPGDVFGDVRLLLRENELFDARAVEDSVVLSIDAETVFALLAQRPRFAQRWLVSLAERTASIQQRLLDLLAGPLNARVASLLLHEADGDAVGMSQARMATLVGAGRPAVNQVLKKFEADGLIELGYRVARILDRPALEAIVGGTPARRDLAV